MTTSTSGMEARTMPDTIMMECGHAATLKNDKGEPSCFVCWPDPKARTPAKVAPDLTGRVAKCDYFGKRTKPMGQRGGAECDACRQRIREGKPTCACEKPSSVNLAFFSYRGPGTTHYKGEAPHDEYYCGCFGWD